MITVKEGSQGCDGLCVVPKVNAGRLFDVHVCRGEGGSLLEAQLKVVGGCRNAWRMEGKRNVLKVSEL